MSAFAGGFLDPSFGTGSAWLRTAFGVLLGVLVTTAIYTGIHAIVMRRLYGIWGHWQIYPTGIVIVGICVVVCKIANVEPGYIYGVMLSYSLGTFRIPPRHEGRLVALGYLVVLAFSVGNWLLWPAVKDAASAPSPALATTLLSSVMAAVFMGGICSLVFGLMPLRFLDGAKLFSRERILWLALFAAGLFLFVHVVLNNSPQAPHAGRSYVVAITFFTLFGLASAAFWAYFRFRPEPAPAVVAAGDRS
jgi:hypothetical protein